VLAPRNFRDKLLEKLSATVHRLQLGCRLQPNFGRAF
jgi:hypothetical protein